MKKMNMVQSIIPTGAEKLSVGDAIIAATNGRRRSVIEREIIKMDARCALARKS